MSKTRTVQKSFVGGNMSPAMHARVADDVRAQNGFAADTRNMVVLQSGAAMRRRGFRHVALTKLGSTKKSVLRAFDITAEQSLQIEIGEKHFRWYENGAPLRWSEAAPFTIVSVDTTQDSIKLNAPHGLAVNDLLQFVHSTGVDSNLPGNLIASAQLQVHTVVDARTIKVKAVGGALITIGDAGGAGTSYMYRAAQMPRNYFPSDNFNPADVTFTPGTNYIDLGAPHGLQTGDTVTFTTTNTLPTYDVIGGPDVPIGPGITWYVVVESANRIRIALTLAKAFAFDWVEFLDNGLGVHTVHRVYSVGDLAYWQGPGHGVYYCSAGVANNIAPTDDTAHWHPQGRDGVYEIPHPYLENELAEIDLHQENDTVTLTHKGNTRTFVTTGDSDINPTDDTITENNHGLVAGTVIQVKTSLTFPTTSPAGLIVEGTNYYVVQPQTNTFKISLTLGGTPIDITDDAVGASLTWTWAPTSPSELKRYSATKWIYSAVSFTPPLAAPVATGVTRKFGIAQEFYRGGDELIKPTVAGNTTENQNDGHALLPGDNVYIERRDAGQPNNGLGQGLSFDSGTYPAGFYEVCKINNGGSGAQNSRINVRHIDAVTGGPGIMLTFTNAFSVFVRRVEPNTEMVHDYRVTAVDENGLESLASNTVSAQGNNLFVEGASNTVTWNAVPGAARYNIYRKKNKLYGLIGSTSADQATEFKDEIFDSDGVDLSHTLPIQDNTIGVGEGNYPACVTKFDERKTYACTRNFQNRVWMSRVGADKDMSFHVPVFDDDRLRFSPSSGLAVTIRHLVPLKRLVLLTDSSEVQVIPVNSEVLTPNTIEARTNSNEGSSTVRPVVLSGNILYAAARGGHLLELGESPSGELTRPGNLCLRTEHLFEHDLILDQSAMKAPHQISWLASSSGLLLGLTYIPQEQVGAWHAHNTAADGFFESVSVGGEGDEDALYAIVRRTINGQTVRSVERMANKRYTIIEDAYFVDAGGTFDGRSTDGSTMTISGGTFWRAGESVTVTASAIKFVLGTDDVGDHVAVRPSQTGPWYRVRITAVSSPTVATGVLLSDFPTTVRNTPLSNWAFARDVIGVPHLEGQTVKIFADALVQTPKVVTSGIVTLSTPAIITHVGLGMPTKLKLLPAALQAVEAAGQDREVNINQAFLRVLESGPFRVGALEEDAVPANEPDPGQVVKTDKVDIVLLGNWQPDTEATILIEDPLPLTILGMVLEVSLGGG